MSEKLTGRNITWHVHFLPEKPWTWVLTLPSTHVWCFVISLPGTKHIFPSRHLLFFSWILGLEISKFLNHWIHLRTETPSLSKNLLSSSEVSTFFDSNPTTLLNGFQCVGDFSFGRDPEFKGGPDHDKSDLVQWWDLRPDYVGPRFTVDQRGRLLVVFPVVSGKSGTLCDSYRSSFGPNLVQSVFPDRFRVDSFAVSSVLRQSCCPHSRCFNSLTSSTVHK